MHLTHLIMTVKHRCVRCGAEVGSARENDTCELALTPGDLQDASMGYVSSRLSMYVMCEHAGCHVDDKFSIRIELPDVELVGGAALVQEQTRGVMDFTKYTNDVDFVPRPDSDEGSAVINEWRESKKKHDERERELTRDFIIDALTELNILDHPMGYRAFQVAFQEKWISSGYPGVFFLLEEIAALLKGEPPPSDPPSSPR